MHVNIFCLLGALACGARIGGRASGGRKVAGLPPAAAGKLLLEDSAPCGGPASFGYSRRSAWCEGHEDTYITLDEIETGQGLCLDGQCYGASSLRRWLQRTGRLPHNRRPFTTAILERLLNISSPLLTAESPVILSADALLHSASLHEVHALTGASDGSLQLWSIEEAKAIRRFVGHSDAVNSAQFSPDGGTVLTASSDRTVRLWDTETGGELRRFEGHGAAVLSAVFSPNGSMILSGSYDGTIRLWEVATGRVAAAFRGLNPVVSVAFRPHSALEIFAAVHGSSAWSGSIASGGLALRALSELDDVYLGVFSPDGKRLLTSCDLDSRVVVIRDAASGAKLLLIRGHARFVSSAAFSPDGGWVLTGSADFSARLWDAGTGQELRRFSDNSSSVFSVAFSPDGQRVIVASASKARIYSIADLALTA